MTRGAGWFSLPKALARKALSRGCIAFGREKAVDRRTAGAHGPVQVHPLAFNAHISFVHAPTIVGWFESPTQTSFHFRGIALDPSPHRDVIGAQALLRHEFPYVARREREAQIPTAGQENHLRFKLAPLEQTGH